MDLSKLSDADLDALEAGDLTKLSDAGLALLEGPAPRPDQTDMPERFGRGLRDPIDAGAQLLTRALPDDVVRAGNRFNNWLADKTGLVGRLPEGGVDEQVRAQEAAYQARRGDQAGKFDTARLAGNILNPATMSMASAAPRALTLAGRMATGAGLGAASGALQPVTGANPDNFWADKAMQTGLGALFGGAAPVVGRVASRAISPRASTNPQLRMLTERGVQPTIGQTLGGMANRVEEKLTSVPIMGDAIAAARNRSQRQFNEAAINEVLEPLRGVMPNTPRIAGTGAGAVDDAHQAVSQAYTAAKQAVGGVRLDNQFYNDLGTLRQMSTGLTPPMQQRFNNTIRNYVMARAQNGGMTAETFKRVDADLGEIATKFQGSSAAASREYGDAVRQLQALLNQQGYRSNPRAQELLDAADASFARLVRIEDAAKKAINTEGQFTPGQLNQAVREADRSVRKNATARGQALLQDLSSAGQTVLGNRVPDSGTAGRLAWGVGALGAGAVHPAIPGALLAGAAGYAPPVQALLRGMVTMRPQAAQPIAGALEQAAPRLAIPAAQAGLQALE